MTTDHSAAAETVDRSCATHHATSAVEFQRLLADLPTYKPHANNNP